MQTLDEDLLNKLLPIAQVNLNDAYRHYKEAPTALAREFVEIKLQVCIFQYDVCVEITSVIRTQPTGFAVAVALKGLILRLFEFDLLMKQRLYPRLLALAKARDIEVDIDRIRKLKQSWKVELSELQKWHDVRNEAAGHYGKNLSKQVAALEGLSFPHVMGITVGFLHFAQGLWMILRDTGKGVLSDDRPLNVSKESTTTQQ